ncbi:MAG: hypothetical protein JO091_11045 [Acidobacteriaceae bacterium]|nr:hypothetical protein [Acidobacteriaceae bacterium]
MIAKEIKFKASELKLANAIHAGLTQAEDLAATKQNVQANEQELESHQHRLDIQGAQILDDNLLRG